MWGMDVSCGWPWPGVAAEGKNGSPAGTVPCGEPGLRKTGPLNNNNRGNNNNRRRSRGNNGRPQQGGGQQLNRIDSRARGNAPQMLEKYRKLAQDAHLNGDRVTAEYYLQFADHYFRVIADTRVRQDETRGRRDERWGENGEGAGRDDAEDGNDFSVEADFPAFDQPPVYTRRDREDRGGERAAERGPNERGPNERGPNERGNDRPAERAPDRTGEYRRRDERGPRDAGRDTGRDVGRDTGRDNGPRDEASGDNGQQTGAADGDQGQNDDFGDSRGFEPAPITPSNNPFVRDNRGPRAARPPREDRRPRRDDRGDERPAGDRGANPRREEASAPVDAPVSVGLDPSLLPPAISISRRDAEPAGDGHADDAPAVAPRRRARRKPVADAGDAVETLD